MFKLRSTSPGDSQSMTDHNRDLTTSPVLPNARLPNDLPSWTPLDSQGLSQNSKAVWGSSYLLFLPSPPLSQMSALQHSLKAVRLLLIPFPFVSHKYYSQEIPCTSNSPWHLLPEDPRSGSYQPTQWDWDSLLKWEGFKKVLKNVAIGRRWK